MLELKNVFSSDEARYNFILACIRVAAADDEICEEESEYLTYVAQEIGLGLDRVSDAFIAAKDGAEVVRFETRKESLTILKELISLCHIDGNYSASEKAEICKIASELNIEQASIDAIEDWVSEGTAWVENGKALVENLAGAL
ncbi:MAG: TerB family tellurite resistance protein [Deltaproteobacteria bacterium]|nr:TerB family tellurite resistance protein [Deltaproteobacteria bacterium]